MRESLMNLWARSDYDPDKTPPDLCVECPECYVFLWVWFCELWRGEPLSYAEILAWSQLTDNEPTPEDVRLIKKLDAIMRSD